MTTNAAAFADTRPVWTGPRLAPRAADRALHALGSLSFKIFLAAQFLSLTRLFFINHVGQGVGAVATLAGIASVALLLPAVLVYGIESGGLFGRLIAPARAWIAVVLAVAGGLFLYGWLVQGYMITAVVHDLAPYLTLLGCTVLGSIPRVWRDADRTFLVIFAAALAVNAVGMTEITQVVSESTADDRAGISIVAYRTQQALAFWPMLFFTARFRSRRTAAFIFAGVFFVLAQQILFQKRSPTVRILLYILVFLVVLPALHKALNVVAERRVRALFLTTGVSALVIALSVAPWLFQGQLAGLTRRLSGSAYSGGATGMLTSENERFFEVGMFFRTLQPEEWVIGKGFGGYFVPDADGWGTWLDDANVIGRRQLHVGALMPFFKGGLVLAAAYYFGFLLALARGRRLLSDPGSAAAFFALLLHSLFLLQEGFFIMSVAFDLVVVGLCLGYLLSRDRDAEGAATPRTAVAR